MVKKNIKSPKDQEDFSLLCSFEIPGNPATKKNSSRIIMARAGKRRIPRIIPSAQFMRYEKHCKDICTASWASKGNSPIDYGVMIRIEVWLNAWRIPDHVGILQSLGDIFQKYKIVADDKYIQWTDYNLETKEIDQWFKGVDKENPRVNVFIYRYRSTTEKYDDMKAEKLEIAASKPRRSATTTKKRCNQKGKN